MASTEFKDRIVPGMIVRSQDGEKLGKVTELFGSSFEIEKGFFFPKEYTVSYDEIAEVRGDEIILAQEKSELLATGASRERAGAATRATETRATGAKAPEAGEEVRIPLAEEELRAQKRVVEAGEVRVTKDVVTEEQSVTVPVMKEVVRVERVPASGEPATGAFEKEEVTIPVREEQVEVTKQPVVREEVRITKEAREAEATATGTVRREEAQVESQGDLRRRDITEQEALKEGKPKGPKKAA